MLERSCAIAGQLICLLCWCWYICTLGKNSIINNLTSPEPLSCVISKQQQVSSWLSMLRSPQQRYIKHHIHGKKSRDKTNWEEWFLLPCKKAWQKQPNHEFSQEICIPDAGHPDSSEELERQLGNQMKPRQIYQFCTTEFRNHPCQPSLESDSQILEQKHQHCLAETSAYGHWIIEMVTTLPHSKFQSWFSKF